MLMGNERCPLNICDGSGIILYEDNTYAECQCRRAMHIQNYLGKAFIPLAYKNKTFGDFDPTHENQIEMLERLKEYVSEWSLMSMAGEGVSLISTSTRVGKSHMACAVAHALIERYQQSIEDDVVLFINVTNWIDRWKLFYAKFGKDADEDFIDYEEKQKEINALGGLDTRMNHADLLILDDIGEVPGTDYVCSKLYSVVEYRTSNNKPILITSNHPWETIARKYGDDGVRIVDRLKEKSANHTFYFDVPLPKKKVKTKKK
jgi:DNA replication protein DnaC